MSSLYQKQVQVSLTDEEYRPAQRHDQYDQGQEWPSVPQKQSVHNIKGGTTCTFTRTHLFKKLMCEKSETSELHSLQPMSQISYPMFSNAVIVGASAELGKPSPKTLGYPEYVRVGTSAQQRGMAYVWIGISDADIDPLRRMKMIKCSIEPRDLWRIQNITRRNIGVLDWQWDSGLYVSTG